MTSASSSSAAPEPSAAPPRSAVSVRSVLRPAVAAAVVGGLSLVEPRRQGPWGRAAYRLGTAAASGLLVADTTREEEALLSRGVDGVLVGAATLGLMDLAEHLDARVIDALGRGGVGRPRWVLAALGAAGTLVVYGLEARSARRRGELEADGGAGADSWAEDLASQRDLPDAVRAAVAHLLAPSADGTDLPGAAALRAQLPSTRAHGPADEAEVWLLVPETAQRAVPRHQTWPVRGAFVHEGRRLLIELQIDDGLLSMLSLIPAGPAIGHGGIEHDGEHDLVSSGPLEALLPEPAGIEILRETEAP
ncbi:hypothetical protein [Brachybacterium sp.]|uniref:hypothetical protein n=1 Tax=Brachybacterium sp. TaxID=1891286 RepID=UPI002ED1A4F3